MKTDLLLNKRNKKQSFNEDKNTPYLSSRKQMKDLCQERELSPWSSEEYRAIRPNERLQNIKFGNAVLSSMQRRYEEGHPSDIPQKGRSLELRTVRGERENKISKQFFQIVKLQKRKLGHYQDNIPFRLTKIDMTLNCTEDSQRIDRENISLGLNEESRFKIKEQPVKVKIAKKLKGKNHREETQERPQTDRVYLYQSLKAVTNDPHSRVTQRRARKELNVSPMRQSIELPALQEDKVEARLFNGDEPLFCKGDTLGTRTRGGRKYRLVSGAHNGVSYFHRI